MPSLWKSECPLQTLKQRAFLMSKIREFFAARQVLEVETPILSSAGNTDINIESFSSENIRPELAASYLRTSPEFPLKRLLCSGSGDIFELGKVFRRGEVSKTHNVEFTMLEWYRVGFDYQQLYKEVVELFQFLLQSFGLSAEHSEIISYSDCFKRHMNLDIIASSVSDLNKECINADYSGSELTRDEALDYLFATQIQPRFEENRFTIVTLYPASQAALSQICPKDPSVALRFEVFYQGNELANGYQELGDSIELRTRFIKDKIKRKMNNQRDMPIDNNLLNALKQGMPPCSGVAVGVDRLFMALTKTTDIKNTITFTSDNA